MSYGNQRDHPALDRRLVVPWLGRLAELEGPSDDGGARAQRMAELLRALDPASPFEREVLEAIDRAGLPLPDRAQFCPAPDVPVQVDFYWARGPAPGLCLFVDGPVHRDPALRDRDRALRGALERRGFAVFAIEAGAELDRGLARLRELLRALGIGGG
ncbi:MAG: hypothetical protein K6T74_10345 [Geminicoccaceae bacterium]|nr:hypothetical protein [Geminicoccaceae bacterium]